MYVIARQVTVHGFFARDARNGSNRVWKKDRRRSVERSLGTERGQEGRGFVGKILRDGLT
jgi:hypothetical protein